MMKNIAKILLPIAIFFTISCNKIKKDENTSNPPPTPQVATIPTLLFGANLEWKHLAGKTMGYGDIIRDRSFRCKADSEKVQVWGEFSSIPIGTITWNTTADGDLNPKGGNPIKGFVELSRPSSGFTGINQVPITGVKAGGSYTLNFSSYGINGTPTIEIYLYSSSYSILASQSILTQSNLWTQHEIILSPNADDAAPILAIYLTSTGSARIDEVRLAESGSQPVMNSTTKSAITNLGVKSLRWPGGTLVDWFNWKYSIGSRINRGELQASNYYETPVLGLHEFLDLCEELNITPLVQINILDTTAIGGATAATMAADLIEYILGADTTTQGAIRSANGRADPWNVKYFEIGNEPSADYSGGSLPDTGSNYGALAKNVITSAKAKASELGKEIEVGLISEGSFQLASWLDPILNDDNIDLLYYWNDQVFNTADLASNSDFTNVHFYSSRNYSTDEEINFNFAMSGGAVLKKTIDDKISPLTSLPIWLTEYHIATEDSGVIQTSYLKDFQSGLAIADILITLINSDIKAAHIHNLIDTVGFGIIRDPQTNILRPAGLVFNLISVMAGEEKLEISTDNNSTFTITSGAGNVPDNFSYPLISAIASKNAITGKSRVILLNRDYQNEITVIIDLEKFVAGDVTIYKYENNSLSANNESITGVAIMSTQSTIGDTFTITIPEHSLWRIDFT